MIEGDDSDQANLKATYSLLFFGVPNRGMKIKGFIPIVEDRPNRYLVETLSNVSEVLREQSEKFPVIFHFRDSVVISFYETMRTQAAQEASCTPSLAQISLTD